jgi:glycerol kinase
MRNPFELDYDSVDGDSEPPHDFEAREEHVNQHQEDEQQRKLNLDFRPKQENHGDRSLLQDQEDDPLKNRFIGTIDQGTTSTRFIIFDCTGVPVAKYQTEFRQIHDHPG